MGKTIKISVTNKCFNDINRIAKIEGLDESETVRKLIIMGLKIGNNLSKQTLC